MNQIFHVLFCCVGFSKAIKSVGFTRLCIHIDLWRNWILLYVQIVQCAVWLYKRWYETDCMKSIANAYLRDSMRVHHFILGVQVLFSIFMMPKMNMVLIILYDLNKYFFYHLVRSSLQNNFMRKANEGWFRAIIQCLWLLP